MIRRSQLPNGRFFVEVVNTGNVVTDSKSFVAIEKANGWASDEAQHVTSIAKRACEDMSRSRWMER